MSRLALWAHPVGGAVVTALAVRAATLGLGARRPGMAGERARRAHRALVPWLYALVVASFAGGVASVAWGREDLAPAASGHFQVGCGVVAAFTLAALVSRRIGIAAWARAVHPWLGVAGLLAAGVQVFLGLQIMPR